MLKEELLKKILSDFGEVQAMLYCRMESAKNAYLFEDCVKKSEDLTCTQYDYERDWWKDAENKLSDGLKF